MIVNKIDTADISVVVQGPVDNKFLPKLLKSIERYLPDSEIIISTWNGSEEVIEKLNKKMTVLYNEDPGCSFDDPAFKRAFNINRWIVSSKNGVEKATRKYVLKCRSDCEIINTNFLKYWNYYKKRESEFTYSEHKILIPAPYTLKFLGKKKDSRIETPFHVSDWYCFGLKDDVLNFVSCPLIANLNDFARYYEKRYFQIPYNTRWWMDNWYRRYAPEQYIGLSYAKGKFPDIDIENVFTFKNFDRTFAERFLISNFLVLDPIQFGIILNKYRIFSRNIHILSDDLWEGMYRNFIYRQAYCRIFKKANFEIIDMKNFKHKIKMFINKLKAIRMKLFHRFKKTILDCVKNHMNLHVVFYSLHYLPKGFKVYKTLRDYFKNEKTMALCTWRGTGDSYIVGNYIKNMNLHDKYNFVVPRNINKKILEFFGISDIFVLDDKDYIRLLQFNKIFQLSDIKCFHFAPRMEYSNLGYNLAGFKNLNFFDFYDYLVFGLKSPLSLKNSNMQEQKISESYISKLNIKKGKTIVLAPYSDSIIGLQNEEWKYLAEKLSKKGYDILTNCGSGEAPIENTCPIFLPLDKMKSLVEYCGYFISVRSGLCDILLTANCKKIILYPQWINYFYGTYKDFFTINIPKREIYADEYCYNQQNNIQILDCIINSI